MTADVGAEIPGNRVLWSIAIWFENKCVIILNIIYIYFFKSLFWQFGFIREIAEVLLSSFTSGFFKSNISLKKCPLMKIDKTLNRKVFNLRRIYYKTLEDITMAVLQKI